MIQTLAILLGAAALAVPLSRRAGFGSILGYLLAGIVIGPAGLRLVTDVNAIASVSGLGVVMLLFLIGLELRPGRLWVMRRAVFGLGTAQLVASGALLAAIAHVAGLGWPGAAVMGAGFALSSTAIVLPLLAERDLLATRAGRDSFSVLLFQDLSFVPLVALVPLLGGTAGLPTGLPWPAALRAMAAVAAILVGGRYLLRPAFRAIGGARTQELFTMLALLVVVGTAALAQAAGLSASLGAFIAGVLFSDSSYRHELQADIEPFEGLLLGFFFISVGMSVHLDLVLREPVVIALAVAGLIVAKAAVGFVLGRLFGEKTPSALRFALALSQGSEFSFVLFEAAQGAGALNGAEAAGATVVVALSMVMTPLIFAASEATLVTRLRRRDAPAYDRISEQEQVIICGFGRVGQIIARILRMQRIRFVALEKNNAQVEVARRFGSKVYYGDPARPDLLRAAGAEHARLMVIAIDSVEDSLRIVEMVRRVFPALKLVVRARNRRHAHLLMERGVDALVRDTFHSSLRLAALALRALEVPEERAERAVGLFETHDERLLFTTLPVWRDEAQMIQTTQQAAEELRTLFEADLESEEAADPGS